ncbi:MAG: hypothetical protein HYZ42_13950 [Bacteroidetes bacterium]|nr:hypothetical protein [Bacteroidota bacterium]
MKNLLDQLLNESGNHAEKFKEKLALSVLFEGRDPHELVEEYQLASVYTLTKWVEQYQKRLSEGLITLPSMSKDEKHNVIALQNRIKELQKALDQANVLIYGLNSMIDFAEKELNVPIRKKRGTKR